MDAVIGHTGSGVSKFLHYRCDKSTYPKWLRSKTWTRAWHRQVETPLCYDLTLTTHHVNGVTGTEEANINKKRETMNYHCESLINLKVWFLWAEALNPALRRSYDRHETNSDKECLSERCFRTYRIISVTMNLNDRPGKDTATKKDKRKTRITPSKPTKETTTNSNKFLQK